MGNHTNNNHTSFRFLDRSEAGNILANRLKSYVKLGNVVVLALPRGGVPVGAEIASKLNAPLFAFIVRKLGVPGHEELAVGAIVSGGSPIINTALAKKLGLSDRAVDSIIRRQTRVLSRRQELFCAGQKMPELKDKIVMLVDDGATTGSSLSLAVEAVQQQGAAYVIVAVPVAPPYALSQINKVAAEVICLMQPTKFISEGHWYQEFHQVTDREVCQILERFAPKMPVQKSA